jgi:hypothetical protein
MRRRLGPFLGPSEWPGSLGKDIFLIVQPVGRCCRCVLRPENAVFSPGAPPPLESVVLPPNHALEDLLHRKQSGACASPERPVAVVWQGGSGRAIGVHAGCGFAGCETPDRRRLKELRDRVGGVQGRTSSTGPQGSEPSHGTFAGPYSAAAQVGWGSPAWWSRAA